MAKKRGDAKRRFITLSVPGRDDSEPAAWFVYDTHRRRSERCRDRAEAMKLMKARNAKGA